MFKCDDCGKTYNKKPDYCDCGNNVFEEFGDRKKEKVPLVLPFSYFALTVFLSCIILSLLTVCFLGNNWVNNTLDTRPKSVKHVQNNIPDIENVWKNSPQKVEPVVVENSEEQAPEDIVKVVVSKPKVQIEIKNKQVKTDKKAVKKPVEKVQKAVVKAPQKPAIVKQTNAVAKKETSVQKTQSSSSNESAIELNKYKTALRKALFFNLEILTIQGQGDCVIEFNVDDSGKLINRNFYKTSENVSVNNAVYKMMMKLPQYYPPPPSYKGEKLRLKFSFDNGSYEINYI